MIIIGYRPNFTHYCGRGCNCVEGGMDSELWIDSAASASEAADVIASRLLQAKKAKHLFLVAREGVPLEGFRSYSSDYTETGEHSIRVIKDEAAREDTEGEALEAEIRSLIDSKLSALEKKEEEAAEAKRLKEYDEVQKYAEKQELAQLARLKAKYEAGAK